MFPMAFSDLWSSILVGDMRDLKLRLSLVVARFLPGSGGLSSVYLIGISTIFQRTERHLLSKSRWPWKVKSEGTSTFHLRWNEDGSRRPWMASFSRAPVRFGKACRVDSVEETLEPGLGSCFGQ